MRNFVLFIVASLFLISCGPSQEEKSFASMCKNEGPQTCMLDINPDLKPEECFFFDNKAFISVVSADIDNKIITLDMGTNPNGENCISKNELEQLLKGDKDIIVKMAANNVRLQKIIKQASKLGYGIKISITMDEVVFYDNSIVSRWNL